MSKLKFLFVVAIVTASFKMLAQSNGKTEWFDPDLPAKTYCNPINIGYNYVTKNHNNIPISRS